MGKEAMKRLVPKKSVLLVVDVQERLAPAMPKEALDRLIKNTLLLLDAASELGVPVVVSEQYTKGLGPTIAPIADRLKNKGISPIEKMTFDAAGEPRVLAEIQKTSPESVIVAGMETHVCVFQTVRSLTEHGYATYVVADAVSSRTEENRALGLRLCERAGGIVTPAETVAFDWLERAGTPEFKAVSRLLK
ncbi:MAG: isochorismatase family protein, partial [Polyangiaceae bacterium]